MAGPLGLVGGLLSTLDPACMVERPVLSRGTEKRLPFPKLCVLFPGAIVPGCQDTRAFRCHPGDWGLGMWV